MPDSIASSRSLCSNSEATHSTPRLNSMPMKGGRCVTVLNTGTNSSPPMPTRKIALRCEPGTAWWASSWLCTGLVIWRPRRRKVRNSRGIARQTRLGRKIPFMIFSVVIWPPIHSIVVVTSPIGVQAPPALAAITMIPAKNRRSSWSSISLRISEIITIVVVRLSSAADRKKVTKPMIHSSVTMLVERMRSVMIVKPP